MTNTPPQETGTENVVDLRFDLPVRYDSSGQIMWSADNQRFLDVRSWGFLTGTGGLNLPWELAAKTQDARGEFVAKAVNEFSVLTAELKRVEVERDRYEAALEHYADKRSWIKYGECGDCFYVADPDNGYDIAATALEDDGEKG